LMGRAVRDWKVTDYEVVVDSLKLPDADDRHVLAAAIKAKAQIIVTANLRDFPAEALRPWDIDPKSPDEFVRDQISLDRGAIYAAVQQIADSWRNPPGSVDDVLDRLERSGPGNQRGRTPGRRLTTPTASLDVAPNDKRRAIGAAAARRRFRAAQQNHRNAASGGSRAVPSIGSAR
jgi:hypothetical protein